MEMGDKLMEMGDGSTARIDK